MKRLAITAAGALAATLLVAAPAHADTETDNWTLAQCTERYHRVVSIGEGLAHQNAVLTDQRDEARTQLDKEIGSHVRLSADYERLGDKYVAAWTRARRVELKLADKTDQVRGQRATIRDLRAKLRRARR